MPSDVYYLVNLHPWFVLASSMTVDIQHIIFCVISKNLNWIKAQGVKDGERMKE